MRGAGGPDEQPVSVLLRGRGPEGQDLARGHICHERIPVVSLREAPWASFNPHHTALLSSAFSGDVVQSGRLLPRAQDQG